MVVSGLGARPRDLSPRRLPARPLIPRWGLVVVVGGGLLLATLAAGVAAIRQFSGFDLRRVPTALPAYLPGDLPSSSWRTVSFRGMTVQVPPMLSQRQAVASAPEALVLTTVRQTLWLSLTVSPLRSPWAFWWYRTCLYARINPVGLMGKGLLVPPLGTRTPALFEQPLGPWRAFLYAAPPHRLAADLFDGPDHVTAMFVARREGVVPLELAREILASVRVRRVRRRD